jgi:hypothetical protein
MPPPNNDVLPPPPNANAVPPFNPHCRSFDCWF